MKYSSAAAAFALAATASAQGIAPYISLGESLISQQCLSTIESIGNSTSASCVNIQGLAPLLTTNGSIVPVLDNWMSGLCSGAPCSNATLMNVTQAITSGCGSDLAKLNVTNTTVAQIIAQYPLAREVLCLKTSKPFNATNATIPISSPPYNLTNGTFCVTSLLTSVSAYTGTNLTTSSILSTVLGGTASLQKLAGSIPKSALCQDCVFGAVDIILREYPQVANLTISNNMLSFTNSSTGNYTLGSFLDGVCPANYTWTTNGTLPSTLVPSAYNSTFQFNITAGNMTYSPANVSARSYIDVTAAKRRMMGQRV